MDRKEIEDLIALMRENGVTELSLETPELKISLKRQPDSAEPSPPAPSAETAPTEVAEASPEETAPASTRDDTAPVISPIVGIFHNGGMLDPRRPFSAGDRVEEGELLAAIESMKIPNELRAPFAGTVCKVLVRDGEPVQYGQALFLIEPEGREHEPAVV